MRHGLIPLIAVLLPAVAGAQANISFGHVTTLSFQVASPATKPSRPSQFHFTFSAEASPRPDRADLFRADPSLAGERLLIVDDNETMRELLSRHSVAGDVRAAQESEGAAGERLPDRDQPAIEPIGS